MAALTATIVEAAHNSEKNDRGEFQHKQYITVSVEDLLYRTQQTVGYQYLSCKMMSEPPPRKKVWEK
jgi:hypothetical protein